MKTLAKIFYGFLSIVGSMAFGVGYIYLAYEFSLPSVIGLDDLMISSFVGAFVFIALTIFGYDMFEWFNE